MPGQSLRFEGVAVAHPTPIVDETRVRANIARMAAKAHASAVRLRPHFKTHQSAEIGGWFHEHGVSAITVSSLRMARYFADHGWRDITVAFPVNLRELDEVVALARAISLGVLVDDPSVVRALAGAVSGLPAGCVRVWVKIDTGLGRVGVCWDDQARLSAVGEALQPASGLTYAGALTHAGHSYGARTRAELGVIHSESISRLRLARDRLDAGIMSAAGGQRVGRMDAGRRPGPDEDGGLQSAGELSIGDTPTCSLVERFDGVDEIRPGNFVFYDLMQLRIGSCRGEDLAVALACPVVGKYEQRGEIVIYGGAVHLSKEALGGGAVPREDPGSGVGPGTSLRTSSGTISNAGAGTGSSRSMYGCLAIDPGAGLGRPEPRAPVVALSQEHGVVRVPRDLWDTVAVGDLVLVYPVHACLACDLHARYVTTDGRTIERRGISS